MNNPISHNGFLLAKPAEIPYCGARILRQASPKGQPMLNAAMLILARLRNDRRGVTGVEYGLIAALVCVPLIAALHKLTAALIALATVSAAIR